MAVQYKQIDEGDEVSAMKVETENSLLQLDDNILISICEFLDAESLYQMTNVCKRFRPITESVFVKYHRELKMEHYNKATLRRILIKFSHLITSIELPFMDFPFFSLQKEIYDYQIVKNFPKLEKIEFCCFHFVHEHPRRRVCAFIKHI